MWKSHRWLLGYRQQQQMSGEWACTQCTLINDTSRTTCAICGTHKPITQAFDPSSCKECPRCTFMNHPSLRSCELCDYSLTRSNNNSSHNAPPNPRAHRGNDVRPGRTDRSNDVRPGRTDDVRPGRADDVRPGGCADQRTTDEPDTIPRRPTFQRMKSGLFQEHRANSEAAAEQHFARIVHWCQQNRCQFSDSGFPADDSTLYIPPNKPRIATSWRRPQQIRKRFTSGMYGLSEWVVFGDPRPSDIRQGALGNCWFLSALTLISERPELLLQAFLTREVNDHGVYQLRLCKDGVWQVITIDDRFPCDQNGFFAYSSCTNNQLWVPLVEKAFAKLHGGYEALVGGAEAEAFEALTGASSEEINLQDERLDLDVMWAQLLSAHDHGFLITASVSNRQVEREAAEMMGIITNHAYSLLDLAEVDRGVRLLRLRNPWGSLSWKGAYSVTSHEWTSLRHKPRDILADRKPDEQQGVFWMCMDDFLVYFHSITICKIYPDWTDVRLPVTICNRSEMRKQIVELEVGKRTEIDFVLYQRAQRGSNFHEDQTKLDLWLMVFDKPSDPARCCVGSLLGASNWSMSRCVKLSLFLKPGSYLIIPLTFNKLTSEQYMEADVQLVAYSSEVVSLTKHLADPCVVPDALLQAARKIGKSKMWTDFVTGYQIKKNCFGFVYTLENRSTQNFVKLEQTVNDVRNIVPTRGNPYTADHLPPQHRQVLAVWAPSGGSMSYSFSMNMKEKYPDSVPCEWNEPPLNQRNLSLHSLRPL